MSKLNVILNPENFDIFMERFLKTKFQAISDLLIGDFHYSNFRLYPTIDQGFFRKPIPGSPISKEDYIENYINYLKTTSFVYPNTEAYKLYDFYIETYPPYDNISIPIELYNYMLSKQL